jgi:hypothetical protein
MFVATLTLSACVDHPTADDYDDVAQAVAPLVAHGRIGELASMHRALTLAAGRSVKSPPPNGSVFEGQHAGLSFSYRVIPAANGTEPGRCETPARQAGVDFSRRGEVNLPGIGWSASVAHTGDWTLTNLQTDSAQLDGLGYVTVDTQFTGLRRPVPRYWFIEGSVSYESIRLSPTSGVVGGTLEYEVHAQRRQDGPTSSLGKDFYMTLTVTLAPEQPPLLEIDRVRRYHMDSATGAVKCVHQ